MSALCLWAIGFVSSYGVPLKRLVLQSKTTPAKGIIQKTHTHGRAYRLPGVRRLCPFMLVLVALGQAALGSWDFRSRERLLECQTQPKVP